MIDLHIHSTYSDGTCTIEEIIKEAKDLGLNQIAITDHNILKGSILASKISDIDFIIGTELSVDYNGREIHLLSYFPNGSATNYKNTLFIINEGEVNKKIAIMEMIEKLNEQGFDLNVLELNKYGKGVINRVHICRAMMDHGYISSVKEGFEKYVGDNCPAYVERKKVTLLEAINEVHLDGGIAVIAHPYEYDLDIDEFLNDVSGHIDGIECFHPSATSEQSKHLVEIANSHNLLITGGSDYHGKNKPDIYMNMMKVDDAYKLKRK